MSKTLSAKRNTETVISLGKMHPGQIKAYLALKPHRYKILRCGRRFGKTEFAKIWISQGLLQGWECAWLAPQHKIWSEAYMEIKGMLRPLWESGSMGSSVIRLKTRGRLDFWTLGNEIAGRSRRYRRVVIDEAAFAKAFSELVEKAYSELFSLHGEDAWRVDLDSLIQFFRSTDDTGAIVGRRQATTFQAKELNQ